MKHFDPLKHHRRSIRLKGFDYSSNALYFITICVQHRLCLFGHVKNKQMILNDAGKMVANEWLKLPDRFPNIILHEFVVMPNHFHGILEIVETGPVGAALVAAQKNPNEIPEIAKSQGQSQGQPQGLPYYIVLVALAGNGVGTDKGCLLHRFGCPGGQQGGQPQGLPLRGDVDRFYRPTRWIIHVLERFIPR